MALIVCPMCASDEDLILVKLLDDGTRLIGCPRCGYQWRRGAVVQPARPTRSSFLIAQDRFPKPEDVAPEALASSSALKHRFLAEVQVSPDPRVAPYWRKYQQIFSPEGLPRATPAELKAFANDPTGVYSGIMTEFNKAWNKLGPVEGAEQVRQVIGYLIHRDEPRLEDRLTDLIRGKFAFSIAGFKEALLTKVLCVVYPGRFMTIVTYDQKRIMAKAVYGLDLPDADRVSWTIGRLIVWSNELLRELVGDGFEDQQHAGHFLWWAKDQSLEPGSAR